MPAVPDPRPRASGNLWPARRAGDDTFTTAPEVRFAAAPGAASGRLPGSRLPTCQARVSTPWCSVLVFSQAEPLGKILLLCREMTKPGDLVLLSVEEDKLDTTPLWNMENNVKRRNT